MEIDDIKKLAELARLDMDERAMEELVEEFSTILAYMDTIGEVATREEQSPISEHRNVLREDSSSHEKGVHTEDILAEAPETKEGYVKVKRVL